MSQAPFNDHSFNRFLAQGKLMGSRCLSCGASFVPPRAICVECYQSEMQWREFQGAGRLAAFTVISVVPPEMAARGYGRGNPYCSAVVELDQGGRVDAFLLGVDLNRPEAISIGMPLKARYLLEDGEAGQEALLAFEPA